MALQCPQQGTTGLIHRRELLCGQQGKRAGDVRDGVPEGHNRRILVRFVLIDPQPAANLVGKLLFVFAQGVLRQPQRGFDQPEFAVVLQHGGGKRGIGKQGGGIGRVESGVHPAEVEQQIAQGGGLSGVNQVIGQMIPEIGGIQRKVAPVGDAVALLHPGEEVRVISC